LRIKKTPESVTADLQRVGLEPQSHPVDQGESFEIFPVFAGEVGGIAELTIPGDAQIEGELATDFVTQASPETNRG